MDAEGGVQIKHHRCDINSQIYGTPLNKLRQISPKTPPVRQGNADSCRTGHLYSEIFLKFEKIKNKTI
jgi:hypothetical protein